MPQSGLYLLQLGQSRRHEYEADQLAVALGPSAGMSRCGRRDVGVAKQSGRQDAHTADSPQTFGMAVGCAGTVSSHVVPRRHAHRSHRGRCPAGCRRSLLSGAGDTLRRFMKLETAANPLSPMAAGQGAQGDSPMSTHPAAANRLRRLAQMYGTAA